MKAFAEKAGKHKEGRHHPMSRHDFSFRSTTKTAFPLETLKKIERALEVKTEKVSIS